MEEKWNSRTELLIGKDAIKKLENAKVVIYGIGGVGSFVAEGLARSGIGHIILIDNDVVSISNLNRQIHADTKTIGKKKVDVMKERILNINPNAKVDAYMANDIKEGEESIIEETFSYVIDAVDTISTKLKLVEKANEVNVPIIAAMGAGNKLDPTKFEVTDIYKTSVCPLAKVMRKELKKRNIRKLKVVYSKEEPNKNNENNTQGKRIPGSISFVPSVMGLIIAGEVIKDIYQN